jgi:hypothetical protein
MKKLRVESCESRAHPSRVSVHSQLSILNSQLIIASLFLWTTLASAATPTPAPPNPAPTITPTARPKLTGGFGKPAANPAAADSGPVGPPQSDVVRAAEEAKTRREQKSGVAITNDSLVTDPNKGRITTFSPRNVPPPTPVATRAAEAPVTATAGTPVASPAASTEAEWRQRARDARTRVEAAKQRVDQLETDTKKLESDFYSWDDGNYRDGVIKPAWDKKKEELEAARKELSAADADLAELPDRARRAGALPGWLRE